MEAIPWRIGEDPNILLWIWETEHFKAQIQTDSYRQSFSWFIKDYTQGIESTLADGYQHNFKESEEAIREVLGKSYPKKLGYDKYSGYFATTFTIFSGEKIDFGPLEATSVVVKVRVSDNKGGIKERSISGMLHVIHYSIEVAPEHGQAMKIPPSRIISVKKEYGGYAKPREADDSLARGLRIYPGNVTPGCTGKPGMLDNTVEHPTRAARCPIHES